MKVLGKEIRIEGRLIRIARLDGDKLFDFLDAPEPVLDSLKKCGTRIDLFTFTQGISDTSPKYAYPMEWDNLAALRISTFDAWWTETEGKTRNMIRKSQKRGLEIREVPFDDSLVRGIWEIYNECPIRQGRRFAHYGKDLEMVRKMSATFLENSIFIGAFLGNSLIGFAKLVADERRTHAGLMHIISTIEHRDKAPTNALIAQAVQSCSVRGISYLVYSNFTYGNKQRDGLSDFKRKNGFRRIDLPRYYVPLTSIGRAAFRIGLHRRIIDRFPETLLTKLRELRSAWYKRRFESATGAL